MKMEDKPFENLGGGNSNIFGIFTPNLGNDPILTNIFQMG